MDSIQYNYFILQNLISIDTNLTSYAFRWISFQWKRIIFCIKLSYHRSSLCQGRNIAFKKFKISTFIPFRFVPSAKNEGLIPELFIKNSSSSLDFHKYGMPNPARENVTGGLKPTGLPIVIEHNSLALVGKKIPNAIVCLLSALQFHDIGTQSFSKV